MLPEMAKNTIRVSSEMNNTRNFERLRKQSTGTNYGQHNNHDGLVSAPVSSRGETTLIAHSQMKKNSINDSPGVMTEKLSFAKSSI